MDEEIAIIDNNTRREKIKKFIVQNKKLLLYSFCFLIILAIIFFVFVEYKKNIKIKISNNYNSTIIDYSSNNRDQTVSNLIDIINERDPTYSPLSLYFIIDNNLITDKKKINNLFDTVINEISLEKEIKNLIIYKKALFYADEVEENILLDMLKPLINSESIWRSHALYLVAEYFYSKNEKQKSKEFFQQIISIENANEDIIKEAQKRLNKDLGE